MVINWEENLKKCLKQKKIIPTFHATVIEQHLQKVYLTQLMLKEKMSHQEIHDWFKSAMGDIYDSGFVNRLILTAADIRHPRHRNYTIYITKKEIEYINKLPYNKEFRMYLLALVCFLKFMVIKKGLATVRTADKSYIYYLATGNDYYTLTKNRRPFIEESYRDCLSKKYLTLKTTQSRFKTGWGGQTSRINIVIQAKWIDWNAKDGIKITDPERQIHALCKKSIKEDKHICSMCGKSYIFNTKSKTTLCPDCYKKDRKEYNLQKFREWYKKKKDRLDQEKN